MEHFLSEGDNGRDTRIRAWSGLRSIGKLSAFTAWIIPCSRCARSDIESGLIMGDSHGEICDTKYSGLSRFWLIFELPEGSLVDFYSDEILARVFTVFQFRVVASTDSNSSKAEFESLDLPYPLGQYR